MKKIQNSTRNNYMWCSAWFNARAATIFTVCK